VTPSPASIAMATISVRNSGFPPDFQGYRRYCPYTVTPDPSGTWTAPDLARARRLVRASETRGRPVTILVPAWFGIGRPAMDYLASVFEGLGYPTSVRKFSNPANPPSGQAIYTGWYPDYAAPGGFIPPTLSCSGYSSIPGKNTNFAGFCDPTIDRAMARAGALQTTDPEAASRQWAEIDRDLTGKAPWLAFANGAVVEVKSPRVGNYQVNPQLSTLLDQLWVR
jgi:peptide/nickel transport system substrate-binding protein